MTGRERCGGSGGAGPAEGCGAAGYRSPGRAARRQGGAGGPLDPAARVLAALLFIAAAVSLRGLPSLAVAAGLPLLVALVCARARRRALLLSLWALPLALSLGLVLAWVRPGQPAWPGGWGPLGRGPTLPGLEAGAALVLRVLAGTLTLGLAAGGEAAGLWRGLGRLGVPRLLVEVGEVMTRYLGLAVGELERLRLAQAARGFEPGRRLGLKALTALGRAAGRFWLMSLGRAQRVHLAMLARGLGGFGPRRGAARLRGWRAGEWSWLGAAGLAAALLLWWDVGVRLHGG
ncbi:MAG: energy-coupling factor transporter transmembrane protein EcfT [Acetobacteraceae bacterium]|nr:energy-coupling factor transporter transmembrane protein EcfT [Acetobacteraceae bacterium]